MAKNKLWLWGIIGIVAISLGIGGGLLIRRLTIISPGFNDISSVETTIDVQTTTENISGADQVNGDLNNRNTTFLVDGTIMKISNLEPFTADVKLRIGKVFPNAQDPEIIKTIVSTANTEFVLHNMEENTDSVIDPSLFKEEDEIAVWVINPYDTIQDIDQLTIVRIIKFE